MGAYGAALTCHLPPKQLREIARLPLQCDYSIVRNLKLGVDPSPFGLSLRKRQTDAVPSGRKGHELLPPSGNQWGLVIKCESWPVQPQKRSGRAPTKDYPCPSRRWLGHTSDRFIRLIVHAMKSRELITF